MSALRKRPRRDRQVASQLRGPSCRVPRIAMRRSSPYAAFIATHSTSWPRTAVRRVAAHPTGPVVGGLMLWRSEERGYSPWWAWLEENNWVYRMGLLGYGVFALSAYTLSEAPFAPNPRLFHVLVWAFYFFAHLPDLFSTLEGHPRPRGWHLLPPFLIATANIVAASLVSRIEPLLIERYPSAANLTLALMAQSALVGSAYALHFLVNTLLLSVSWKLNRLGRSRHRDPGTPEPGAKIDVPTPLTETSAEAAVLPKLGPTATTPVTTTPPEQSLEPKSALASSLPKPAPSIPSAPPRPPSYSPGLLSRLFGKRRRPIQNAPQPIQDLLRVFSNTRPRDVPPTLRLCALVAMEDSRRLKTPILLDAPERTLYHADGTLNPVIVSRFFVHLPRIHEFVPASKLGKRVYRPIARRLSRALLDSWPRLLRILAAPQAIPFKTMADLVLNAPTDRPVSILCIGTPPFNHGRAMNKILNHLIRRNSLRHLVIARAASLQPAPAGADEAVLHSRIHAKENSLLVEAGVREHEVAVPVFSDADLREATVILTADEETSQTIRSRLAAVQPQPTSAPTKLIELAALARSHLNPSPEPLSPKATRAVVCQRLSAIEACLAESVLPILIARTTQLETPPEPVEPTPTPPTMGVDRRQVTTFRTNLGALTKSTVLRRRGIPPERIVKLIWSLAQRDGAALLMHGLPEGLRSTGGDWNVISDDALHQCCLNLPFATEVVPGNRLHDYDAILHLIQRAAKQVSLSPRPPASG